MGARNIRIENNNISKSLWGIWGAGHYSSQIDSIYILRNVIGSNVANDYVGFCGIDLNEVNHGMIKDNIVKNT